MSRATGQIGLKKRKRAIPVDESGEIVNEDNEEKDEPVNRENIHALWNTFGARNRYHFDLGRHGFDGQPLEGIPWIPDRDDPSISNRPGRLEGDGKMRTWRLINGDQRMVALRPEPDQDRYFPINRLRRQELKYLWGCFNPGGDNPGLAPGMLTVAEDLHLTDEGALEPRWAFLSMTEGGGKGRTGASMGSAWSTFEYILSDLVIGAHYTGLDLMLTLRDIMCDIKRIGLHYVTEDKRCMLYFQGEHDTGADGTAANQSAGKPTLYCTDKALRVGQVLRNPVNSVLERIVNILQEHAESDTFRSFQFYRVFVAIETKLNMLGRGGNLKDMPDELKILRDGPLYKGRNKGGIRKYYINVEDDEEEDATDCGMQAILYGLANIFNRMQKSCRVVKKNAPLLCKRFTKFQQRITSKVKNALQLKKEIMYEMATFIGWKKGQQITTKQLCSIVKHLGNKYELDVGVVIFDAIYPLSGMIASYDRNHVPAEKICLIHWKYPLSSGEEGGHYDCIYPSYLTTWMQKEVRARKQLKFCYQSLKLIRYNEDSSKGELCINCNYYETDVKAGEWKYHGSIRVGGVLCPKCHIRFKSKACYRLHEIPSHGLAKSACQSRFLCSKCDKAHFTTYDCDTFYCMVCKGKYPRKEKHICYIQPTKEKCKVKLDPVVYSDCEGTRITGHHTAVCIATAWRCRCKDCAGKFNTCSYEHKIESNLFEGKDCIREWFEWLEDAFQEVTVVFHNGGRYDLHLIYLELLRHGKYYVKREAERGTQIIFMTASLLSEERSKKTVEFRFIDSYNFIASSLRQFPTMFNLKQKMSKGRFPYELLNQEGWQSYTGSCPPYTMFGVTELEYKNQDKLSYSRGKEVKEIVDYMNESWDKKEIWNAMEKLKEYTIQDVLVLEAGCHDFRFHFFQLSGTDPFHWVTLAAAVAGKLSFFIRFLSIVVIAWGC